MRDVDDMLREYAVEWRSTQTTCAVDFDVVTAPTRRPRASVRVLVLLVVLAVVVVGAVAAWPNPGRPRLHIVSPAPTTSAGPADAAPRVVGAIDLGQQEQYPAAVTTRAGVVSVLALPTARDHEWVTSFYVPKGPPSAVVLSRVKLPDDGPIGMVANADAFWVSSQLGEQSAHVFRIQGQSITATLTLQGDADLALTSSTLWVLGDKGELLEVDTRTAHVVARLSIGESGYGPLFVSAGPLGVWLSSPYDGSIWRVAPDDSRVQRVTSVGPYASQLVQLGGRLWVATTTGVTAIDPKTGRTALTVDLRQRVRDITTDGRTLWVATDAPSLYRVDPATGHSTPVRLPAAGPILALTADDATGTVWAVTAGTQSSAGPCRGNCPQLLEIEP
jgi:hypothetical protein